MQDFKDEIESVGLTEELEAEAEYERRLIIQESYESQQDYDRESAGLSSLSTDFEEVISELDAIHKLMHLIENIKEEIRNKCEEYSDKYYELRELVENKNLDELNQILNNNLLFKIFMGYYEDEDEMKNVINNIIELNIGDEDYASFGDEIENRDYFSINHNLLAFSDGSENIYKLICSGSIYPRNDDEDTLYITFYKNDIVIKEGSINIYYGYINFNDDGNVEDGACDEISINIDELLSELVDVKESILSDLEIKTNKFHNMIDIFNN